ncbi:lysozyme-like [Topomyia yanbarensis]|uniref:lysozyme-like n=1 Tax=Topomyia yanbarensis TaxID=2498891 RepID=UPI00273C2AF8|nr:lysozyme-like [Topomyia yanbarensis]
MKLLSKLSLFVLVAIVIGPSTGIKFDKCSLAKALLDQGFEKAELRNWVCLVQNESGMDTTKTNKNRNGSTDWGLFQINDWYWCDSPDSSKAGTNDCKVKCSALLTDDIKAASTCAKKIYKRHGYRAWYGWLNKCEGKSLPDLSKCKL